MSWSSTLNNPFQNIFIKKYVTTPYLQTEEYIQLAALFFQNKKAHNVVVFNVMVYIVVVDKLSFIIIIPLLASKGTILNCACLPPPSSIGAEAVFEEAINFCQYSKDKGRRKKVYIHIHLNKNGSDEPDLK